MKRVEAGARVKLSFILETEDEIIEAAPLERPFEVVLGTGKLNPALEALLSGLGEGEPFDFTLEGSLAFGERKPELAFDVARSKLPKHLGPLEVGMYFETLGPDRKLHRFQVVQANEHRVSIDGNHPLAGVPIRFHGKILTVG